MSFSPTILELAENFSSNLPLGMSDEKIVEQDYTIWFGDVVDHPEFTVVQRFRLKENNVESTVKEIRKNLRVKGRFHSCWEIGPSATPKDLRQRLLALGLTEYPEPFSTAMVLRRPLPLIKSEFVIRRAETVEDYVQGFEVLKKVFSQRKESPEEFLSRAKKAFDNRHVSKRGLFVAFFEGQAVAAASSINTDHVVALGGGATLPHMRGRGAYRALVEARYIDAVRVGTPCLIIHAGEMSRPILEKLGFETVAVVQILQDRI